MNKVDRYQWNYLLKGNGMRSRKGMIITWHDTTTLTPYRMNKDSMCYFNRIVYSSSLCPKNVVYNGQSNPTNIQSVTWRLIICKVISNHLYWVDDGLVSLYEFMIMIMITIMIMICTEIDKRISVAVGLNTNDSNFCSHRKECTHISWRDSSRLQDSDPCT
jgi:hypothetical protein